MTPEGTAQFIAGIGYSQGSRRFESSGKPVPTPPARKIEASGYLEYGLTSWLTLIAAPTMTHAGGGAVNAITGSDGSAFGARLKILGRDDRVIALQMLVQPPLGESRDARLASGGSKSAALDLRVMAGRAFTLMGLPAFADIQPGVRLRADPFPMETRLDLTFGIRPVPELLVLVQDFNSLAPAGAVVAATAYSKVQASLVYDLSVRWSLQAGAFRTIAGRNALREMGPLAALWYRF
jgi:hypothetical protein